MNLYSDHWTFTSWHILALLFQQQHILYFYVDSQQVFVFSQVFPSLPSHFTYHVCFKIRVVKFSLFSICLNPLYPQSSFLPVNMFPSRMVWFFVKNHVSLVLWLITKYFSKDITNAFSFQLLSFPKSSFANLFLQPPEVEFSCPCLALSSTFYPSFLCWKNVKEFTINPLNFYLFFLFVCCVILRLENKSTKGSLV